MSKFKFIQSLLENEKFDLSQKERFFKLVSKELVSSTRMDEQVLEEIRLIKEKLWSKGEVSDDDGNVERSDLFEQKFPKQFFNPLHLYQFLSDFDSNQILKGTCHPIDNNDLITINKFCKTERYNYELHQSKISDTLKALRKKYKEKYIDSEFYSNINGFINGSLLWNENIKINWVSPALKVWAQNNPNIPPNLDQSLFEKYESIGFEFDEFKPIHKLLQSEKLKTFTELTTYFKYLFHIRADNSVKKICKAINESKGWFDSIEFDFSNVNESIRLLTNVEKLILAYEQLICLILEVQLKFKLEKPFVSLSFNYDENGNVIFSMHHINTVYKNSIKDAVSRFGNTYGNLIINQLNGLCEFNIQADFGNEEYFRVDYWNFNVWKEKKPSKKKITKIQGVKYILKFKR